MDFEKFLNDTLIPGAVNIAWRLLLAGLLFIVGSLIIKFVVKRLNNGKFAQKTDKTVHHFTVSFVKIAMYVILTVIVVATLGVEMASIIAVIGSIGLAISLAVQGTLSNLASGIMILVFKPFHEGDYIETSGESGTVVEVGIFYTTICTPDNKIVVVPNSGVTSNVLKNYSSKETRRVDVSLTLAHGTDVETVQNIVSDVVGSHALILKDPAPFVRLTGMSGESITVTVRAWVNNADYWDVNFHLLENIYSKLGEAGVSVPHAQVDVHVKENK
ncbi:MAG: mechanosensitive ion channel [Ruminococcaceae bacterium]|nr:mechanosensitive ion channel [Oscillospiraceae bacterium]